MKFLDVKTDFAFKKVFASEDSGDILINFLNSVLEFDQQQKIQSLTIVDPYNIPMLKGMKDTYVDVKAVLNNGNHVIIEMQVLNHEGFEKRILYNAAKKYSAQLKKGEDYFLLNPVIALTITDFELFPDQQDLISHYKLLEKKRFIEYSDDIELIFIELPKFIKTETQLSSVQDKWLYFIKNAGSLEYTPKNLSSEIEKAYQIANEANFSEEELELQHKKRDWIYIQKSSIEMASKAGMAQGVKKGIEQGKKQGIEQGLKEGLTQGKEQGIEQGLKKGLTQGIEEGEAIGRLEEKKQLVINMHQAQVDINLISQVTALSIEEVRGIIHEVS